MQFTKEELFEGKIISFNKPYGWTSFDLVNKIRLHLCRTYGIKKLKVGHAGTLDPLATGVLILCIGRATKNIESIQRMDKEYLTTIRLGATTPSFDLETEINEEFPYEHITQNDVQKLIDTMQGEIEQVPPLFSAKKIDGRRAYMLAREGVKKELKSVRIRINTIKLEEFSLPLLKLGISCSKGTYIRSLARDIGLELNSGGHLVSLERTAIGDYRIENSENVDFFLKKLENV